MINESTRIDAEFSRLLRGFGFVLLLTTNDLILREPGLFLSGFAVGDYDQALIRILVNCTFISGLLAMGAIAFMKYREPRPVALFIMLTTAFACALIFLFLSMVFAVDSIGRLFLYASFGSLGFFAAFGLLLWVSHYACMIISNAWQDILICLAISSLAYVSVFYAATIIEPHILFFSVYAVSLLFSWLTVRYCADSLAESEERPTNSQCKKAIKNNFTALLCISALNFLLTLSRTMLGDTRDEVINLICSFGLLLAAGYLLTVSFGLKKVVNIKRLYQIAFPLLLLFFLFFPLLSEEGKGLFMLASTIVGTTGSTLLFYMTFNAKREFGVSAVSIYGLFSGFMHAILLVGYLCGDTIPASETGTVRYMVLCFIVVYILSLVFMASRGRIKEEQAQQNPALFIGSKIEFENAIESIAVKGKLSQRESEIIEYLILEDSVEVIADKLCISKNTVNTHRKNLYKKLGAHSRQDLKNIISETLNKRQEID